MKKLLLYESPVAGDFFAICQSSRDARYTVDNHRVKSVNHSVGLSV